MKKQARVITIVTTTLLQTNIAFAGYYANPGWATGLIGEIGGTLSAFIPAFIGFALLVFIWGVVQFIATSEEKKREEGRRRMVWGLIGLFVIVSVWGLVALIQSLTGIRGVQTIPPPQSTFNSVSGQSGGPSVEVGPMDPLPGAWCEPNCNF